MVQGLAIGFGVLATLGFVLTLVGWRGRRVGDHPHCRRCEHDLHGGNGVQCSECGADVAQPAARRIGRRERRGRLLGIGLTLLVPTALVGLLLGGAAAGGVDWNRHKPAWWLVHDLGSDRRYLAAVAELQRRLDGDALSEQRAATMVEPLLARQGDRSRPWDLSAGVLLETLRDRQWLGDEAWRRFLSQSFEPNVQVRPIIRQGDPLPMELATRGPSEVDVHHGIEWRGGKQSFYLNAAGASEGLDGKAGDRDGDLVMQFISHGRGTSPRRAMVSGEVTRDWPIGERAVEVVIGVSLSRNDSGRRGYGAGMTLPGTTLAEWTTIRRTVVRVLPADAEQPLVRREPSPAAAGVRAGEADVAQVTRYNVPHAPLPALLTLEYDGPAFDLLADHDAYLVQPGGLVRLGSMSRMAMTTAEGERTHRLNLTQADREEVLGDTVDVVLKFDAEGALRRLTSEPVYALDVTVRGVPVARPDGESDYPPGVGPPSIRLD
jgi:hypothetical protein